MHNMARQTKSPLCTSASRCTITAVLVNDPSVYLRTDKAEHRCLSFGYVHHMQAPACLISGNIFTFAFCKAASTHVVAA